MGGVGGGGARGGADLSEPYAATVTLRRIMIKHNDRQSAKVARAQREPWAIKQLRSQLNKSPDETTRLRLHKQLIKARRTFHEQLKEDRLKSKIKRGGVVSKKQTLWPLTAVELPSGQVHTYLPQCLADAIANFAGKRQGSVEAWDDFMTEVFEGKLFDIEPTEVATAVSQCKYPCKLDHFGLCAEALYMAVLTNSTGWATFFAQAFNNPRWLHAITVKGLIKAKHRCPVLPKDTRFLMPQPIHLQVTHNIVVNKLSGTIEARMKSLGCVGMIMGGLLGYQCMDIMGTMQSSRVTWA